MPFRRPLPSGLPSENTTRRTATTLPSCAHADDRVVATVRHIKVGPSFQRGIAGPVLVVLLVNCRGQIDWMV